MTIKEFSALCQCSTQTLRYYDRIHLLKPVRVDRFTGYRHYEKHQALDFVKIKNLQAADFSIEEIKTLLGKPDEQVLEAFNQKIDAQKQKLARILQIQQSYLKEKQMIEQMIHDLTDFLMRQLNHPQKLMEFGLRPEDHEEILFKIRSYLEKQLGESAHASQTISLMVDDTVYRGAQSVSEQIANLTDEHVNSDILLGDETLSKEDAFSPEQYAPVWETHRFAHVHEFIDRIPVLEDGQDYCFFFELNAQSYWDDVSFPMFMLGAMILKKGAVNVRMGCSVEKSPDEHNHFRLMQKAL